MFCLEGFFVTEMFMNVTFSCIKPTRIYEIQSAVLPAWQMQGHVRVLRQNICDSQAPTVRSYKWNPGSTFLTETAADGKVCTPCASQAVRCKMHRSVENHDLSDNSDRHFKSCFKKELFLLDIMKFIYQSFIHSFPFTHMFERFQ